MVGPGGSASLAVLLAAVAFLAASLASGSQSRQRTPRRRFTSSCSMQAATCSTRVALRTCHTPETSIRRRIAWPGMQHGCSQHTKLCCFQAGPLSIASMMSMHQS